MKNDVQGSNYQLLIKTWKWWVAGFCLLGIAATGLRIQDYPETFGPGTNAIMEVVLTPDTTPTTRKVSVGSLLRTLTTNDTLFSHASRHRNGGSDEIATATPTANAIPKADASGTLNAWVTGVGSSGNYDFGEDGVIALTTLNFGEYP